MGRNVILSLVAAACLFFSASADAQDKPAFKDDAYLAQVDAALKSPAQADWTAIRTLYADTSFYDDARRHGLDGSHFSNLGKKALELKTPEAVAAYKEDLRKYAGSIDTWTQAYGLATKDHADFADANLAKAAMKGIAEAMLKTGDGHSMKTAIHVLSTTEEYFLMRSWYGLTPAGQSLERGFGRMYDVDKLKNAKGEDVGDIFFDISLFYGHMELPKELTDKLAKLAPARPPAAKPPPPPLPPGDQSYFDLVDAAVKDPAGANWDALRALYPGTSFYQRVGGFNIAHHVGAMTDFVAKRMSPEAIEYYRKFQREHFASVMAHSSALSLYKETKADFINQPLEQAAHDGLLQSLRKTGDGKAPATAFRAVSLEEASQLVITMLKPSSDVKVEESGGKKYIVFRGEPQDGGAPLAVYFSIDARASLTPAAPERLPALATLTVSPPGGPPRQEAPLRTQEQREEDRVSFIVLDLTGAGIALGDLKKNEAVYWDILGDGFARATAWPRPGTAFLATDLNGNGDIDSNAELFGAPGARSFETLSHLDSNHDGRIDKNDSVWTRLLAWGSVVPGSAMASSLDGLGIEAINLDFHDTDETLAGNAVLGRGTFVMKGADGKPATRQMASVSLAYDNVNTRDIRRHALDTRALALPDLRGYGVLSSLHTAVSTDNRGADSLLAQVRAVSALTLADMVNNPAGYEDRVNNIIYRWAHSDKLAPDSRGPNIDARQLGALEKLMGDRFSQTGAGGRENPLFWASLGLHQAYNTYAGRVLGVLALQSAPGELFNGHIFYDVRRDGFAGVEGLNIARLDEVAAAIAAKDSMADRRAAWKLVIRFIEQSIGTKNLSAADRDALEAAIRKSDSTLTLAQVLSWVTTVDISGLPGSDYASKKLGLSAKDGDIYEVSRAARSRDDSMQIVYSDIATQIMKDCCKTQADVISYFRDRHYTVGEAPMDQAGKEFGTEMTYTRVLRAVRDVTPWDRLKGFFTGAPEFNMVVVFMNGDQVVWAYAHTQKS